MKKTSVKKLAALLCAVLMLSLFPLTGFAAEESAGAETPPEATETVPAEAPETEEETAAEETAQETEPVAETVEPAPAAEEETPEETPEPVAAEPEETAEVPVETPEIPAATPEPSGEAAEESAEEPAEEASEAPVDAVLALNEYADPEDPLYAKYAQLAALSLDGAGSKTWKNFTTRTVKSNEKLRYGIDVSAWQSSINWTKVKKAGVEFAFLRCAYCGVSNGKIVEDGRFRDYISGAKSVGIRVGVYIFSQAITVAEAKEEADFVLQQLKKYSVDLPVVFDLEHYPGGRFSNAKLSKRATTDICNAFCKRIEAAGYESMVYSNPSMLSGDLYPNELGRLWLAHYTSKTSYSTRGYEYWQCSDDGSVNGIETAVDLDFWFEPTATTATPKPQDDSPFTDVSKSDWFYDTVMKAYKAGVVNGISATTFSPGGTATRGQVVTMLYRTQNSPKPSKTATFTDLTQDWYKDAVSWASEKGVVNGYSEEKFAPDRAITREELVTILYRLKGSPSVTGDLSSFTDADAVHSWAKNAMIWAVKNKIVTGYEDNTLRPKLNATRAEVCTILMRYTDLK